MRRLVILLILSGILSCGDEQTGINQESNPPLPPFTKGGRGGINNSPPITLSQSKSHSPIYREGELLVKFKTGVSKVTAQSVHRTAGSIVKEGFRFINVEHVRLPHGLSVEDALRIYRANPDVEYAEPNYIVRKAALLTDTYFNLQWGLNNTGQTIEGITGTPDADIDAPEAWDIHTGNGNVIVAVIDTGVDYNHPDLAANIWTNTGETNCNNGVDDDGNGFIDDCRGWNFAYPYTNSPQQNNPIDDDCDGHGSHVAGIIGAVGNNNIGVSGVNWNVKIMPVKVLTGPDPTKPSPCDYSGSGSIADVIAGIEYAVTMGAKVINASYTYPQSCVKLPPDWTQQAERDAIKAAEDAGVLFVAAAGNYGCNNDITPFYPASHQLSNIISVAASDSNDNLASWSNYGLNSVHVAAPGVNIYSTIRTDRDEEDKIIERYDYISGTSMATPFVSGLAALIMSYQPLYSYTQIKETILSTVDNKTNLTARILTGGRINAFNSLSSQGYPVRPAGLFATPISNSQINLSWTDNSSLEDGFRIERKTGTGGIYSQTAIVSANVTTYSDTGLSAGTTYYYRVRAYNSTGDSNYSNEAGATTQSAGGEGVITNNPGSCFIATAAYGSYLAPEVRVLRDFRDRWLLADFKLQIANCKFKIPNIVGKAFVKFYYEVSPPIADYIRRHETLRIAVRFILTPIVYGVKYPWLSILVIIYPLIGRTFPSRYRGLLF